jgi:hypothetical protein
MARPNPAQARYPEGVIAAAALGRATYATRQNLEYRKSQGRFEKALASVFRIQ